MSLMSVELVAVEIRKTVVIKYSYIVFQKTKTEDNVQWINTLNVVSVTNQEADDLKVCSQHNQS
jgi:hypothetical protein